MDPQSAPFAPQNESWRNEAWRLQNEMMRVQQVQADHGDRLSRLERRHDDDARMKSVWGSTSPFPAPIGGTPHQTPLHQPQDAFSGFDDQTNNLGGSLHLDPEEEPRRMGAASRANSVRFDESANQGGHWSRSSFDLLPRSGSALGGHILNERTASHKSSAAQSVHSATSGRANSFGLDTGFQLGLSNASNTSPSDTPGFFPGLRILGPVPSIIRCWLNMNFKHDALLYAAICTGSCKSHIDESLVESLKFRDLVKHNENGDRVISLPMYLPEAVTHPATSRPNSPAPQLPSLTIDFEVTRQIASQSDGKSIQVFIGSDTLRAHSGDVLFSTNTVTLYDDDRNKLSIPLVRPENESTFKDLFVCTRSSRAAHDDRLADAVAPPRDASGHPSSATSVSSLTGSDGDNTLAIRKRQQAMSQQNDQDTTASSIGEGASSTLATSPLTSPVQNPSLGIGMGKLDEKVDAENNGNVSAMGKSAGSSGIWSSSWRRDTGSSQNQMDWANAGRAASSNYQRRGEGIKVLKPMQKTTSRTASGPVPALSSPALGQSRFFEDGKKKDILTTSDDDSNSAPTAVGRPREDSQSTGAKPRTSNPIGGASAFPWLKSGPPR